jgi:hypothetical protein
MIHDPKANIETIWKFIQHAENIDQVLDTDSLNRGTLHAINSLKAHATQAKQALLEMTDGHDPSS